MDFHSLSRRDLQALCKKNRIPANMTNLAMADALQALQTVEGIGETQEALQFLSPKKAELMSPELPRSSRRTSSLRVGPAQDDPKERQASPLPRARRVTAKTTDILNLVDEVDQEEKKEGAKEMQDTPIAQNTRRRVSKKEEGGNQEKGPKKVSETPGQRTVNTRRRAIKKEEEIPDTPVTRNGRKASVRRVAESPKVEVEKEERTVGVMTRRRTRQSSTKEVEEVTVDAAVQNVGTRRSTRARSSVKMMPLAREEEEGKDVAGDVSSNEVCNDTTQDSKDLVDQENGRDLLFDKKFGESLMQEEKSSLVASADNREEEEEKDVAGDVSSDNLAETKDLVEDKMKPLGTTSDLSSGDVVVDTEGSYGTEEEEGKDIAGDVSSNEVSGETKDPVEEEMKPLGTTSALYFEDVVVVAEGSCGTFLPTMDADDQDCEQNQDLDVTQEVLSSAPEKENPNIEYERSGGEREKQIEDLDSGEDISEDHPQKEDGRLKEEDQEEDLHDGMCGSPIRRLISLEHLEQDSNQQNSCNEIITEGYEEPPIEELRNVEGSPEENWTVSDGEDEEKREGVDLDLHLEVPPLSDEIPADIEGSGYQMPVNRDSQFPQTNREIVADSTIDQISPAPEVPGSDGSDDLIAKEEETNLDLLLTEMTLDSGDGLAVNPHANPEVPAAATELYDEIPATVDTNSCDDATSEIPAKNKESADVDDGGDLTGEIPTETKESADADCCENLTGEIQAETDESGDDDGYNDLSREIPVETMEDGLSFSNLTGEIVVEAIESGAGMLIGNHTPPESEIIFFHAASSSPLQKIPSPDPTVWSLDAAGRSPAKTPTKVRDLIGNPLESEIGTTELVAPPSDSCGIYRKERTELSTKGDGDNKENSSTFGLTELTRMEVGPGDGEAKVMAKAEKLNFQKKDLNSMSLRKLKSIYREVMVGINNKVEEKRFALKALDENCL